MSLIRIEEKRPEIDIEIGKLKFKFAVTDDSVREFLKSGEALRDELEALDDVDDSEESLQLKKDVLKKGFDLMLGNGAFEQIYEMTPSVIYLMDYFVQLSHGLGDELKKLGAYDFLDEKANKYTRKKGKK